MNDRWLPLRAVLNGLTVGLLTFLTLHLTLGASLPTTIAITSVGGLSVALIVRHLRRTELMRTAQAQGYFAAALIISALSIVMLPENYVLNALRGYQLPHTENWTTQKERYGNLYPEASATIAILLDRATQQYPLADISIHTIVIDDSTVSVSVFDPTMNLVRTYVKERSGTTPNPTASMVDPTSIFTFGWTAISIADINDRYTDLASEYSVSTSGRDDIVIRAPSRGARPQIAFGYGQGPRRQVIYADGDGTYLNGP